MNKINSIFIFALVSTSAIAQSTWSVDPMHSKIGFSIVHMAITDVEGSFKTFEGTVTAKSDDFNGADVTFTVKTGSIDTDNEMRDGHLKSPDFFDAEKNPEIKFVGQLVKLSSGYKLKGNFTMKGVTKPVEFDVQYGGTVNTGRGIKAGFRVTGKINRLDYGLTWSNKLSSGEVVVSDEVSLSIKVELEKKDVIAEKK